MRVLVDTNILLRSAQPNHWISSRGCVRIFRFFGD
jgi:hypothetical protein